MSSKLNRYVFEQFFVSIMFFTFAFAGMFWLAQSIRLIDEVIVRGETISTFFSLAARLLPAIILNVAPVAALGATLYTLSQLAQNGELVVFQAIGLKPSNVLLPLSFLGTVFSLFLMFNAIYLAPKSNFEVRQSVQEVATNFTKNVIQGGRFMFPAPGVTLFTNESLSSGEMIELFVEDRRELPIVRTYFAERGFVQIGDTHIQIALFEGKANEHDKSTNDVSSADFTRTELNFKIDDNRIQELNPWINEKPTRRLISDIQSKNSSSAKSLGEFVHRIFYPLLVFILPVIAASFFLRAPYSRHGYAKTMVFASATGLAITAYQLFIPSFISNFPVLFWFTLLPATLCLLNVLLTKRDTE